MFAMSILIKGVVNLPEHCVKGFFYALYLTICGCITPFVSCNGLHNPLIGVDSGKCAAVFLFTKQIPFIIMSTPMMNAGLMSVSELSCARLNEVLLRKPKQVKRLKIHFYTSEVKLQGFSQKHVVQSRASTFDEAVELFLQKVLLTC